MSRCLEEMADLTEKVADCTLHSVRHRLVSRLSKTDRLRVRWKESSSL